MDAVYAHKSGARNRVKVNDLMDHDTPVVAQLVEHTPGNAEGPGFESRSRRLIFHQLFTLLTLNDYKSSKPPFKNLSVLDRHVLGRAV